MMRSPTHHPFLSLLCLLTLGLQSLQLVGCGDEEFGEASVELRHNTAPLGPTELDDFKTMAYPVLLRDCGFAACHGADERPFRIWGPGRVRFETTGGMVPETFAGPTVVEIVTTLSMAKSMIDFGDLSASPLLRKPLASGDGGAGHWGVDSYGRDVYRTRSDPGYVALREWVAKVAAPAPPVQIEPPADPPTDPSADPVEMMMNQGTP